MPDERDEHTTDTRQRPAVIDDIGHHRYVVQVDGEEAELVYRLNGQRLVLVHTGVPDAIGGRGIGGALVRAAVARAKAEDLTVVPLCPYARQWLERHRDVADTVTVDWQAR